MIKLEKGMTIYKKVENHDTGGWDKFTVTVKHISGKIAILSDNSKILATWKKDKYVDVENDRFLTGIIYSIKPF